MQHIQQETFLADRTRNMGSSAIREILKLAARPDIISLGGGMPSPDAFPTEFIDELYRRALEHYGTEALQYTRTEGFPPLREALVDHLAAQQIEVGPEEVFVTTGSQSVLDAMGKILISPGDRIAVEAPTYLGALQAFNPYEPAYVQIDMDEHGLIPDSLERVIAEHRPKFAYLSPTFQNPTGRTLSLERRKRVAEIIERSDTIVIEDDPYGALRYRGDWVPPIRTFAPDHVLYTGSFSKVFAPGLRVGYYVAPERVRQWLVIAKQGVDLNTSSLTQALCTEFIAGGYHARHLPKIIEIYRPKQEVMLEEMERHFPGSFTWSQPDGGMFIWAEGPAGADMEKIYEEGIRNNVAFVPGKFFFSDQASGKATMRLNFTVNSPENIRTAIERLGVSIRSVLGS
ncbi:MAG: PLP-dependent aminotransferase family protein [Spirochaetota bacterium]